MFAVILFGGLGFIVWMGVWRSWAKTRMPNRYAMLAAPWLGLWILLGTVAHAVTSEWAVPWIDWIEYARHASLIVGVCASVFQRPRWALPPWFRRLRDAESVAARIPLDPPRTPRLSELPAKTIRKPPASQSN
jgi:hypothetical protein